MSTENRSAAGNKLLTIIGQKYLLRNFSVVFRKTMSYLSIIGSGKRDMTKTGEIESGIDTAAWMSDFFEVDASCHVGSLTSAIARGWSTDMIRDIIVADSENALGVWDIEERLDTEGRQYRISGTKRTFVECIRDADFIGEDTVKEIFEHVEVSEVEEIREKAAAIGFLDRLNKILSDKK